MTNFIRIAVLRLIFMSLVINGVFATNTTIVTYNGTMSNNTKIPDADDKEMEAKFDKYALPYGVFGAISHLLTYYSLLCHYYGRRPSAPWKVLEKKAFNAIHVCLSSIITITLAIVALVRIRETQPLVVLASLQIFIDLVVDLLSVHRFLKSKQDGIIRGTVVWGAILYGVSYASIYSMAQMSKSKRLENRWDGWAIFLVIMACGSGVVAFVTFIAWVKSGCREESTTLHVLAVSGLVCSCAYFLVGDYAVAVLTGNIMGIPMDGKVKAVYWVYWVCERLPLLTF